MDQGGLTGDVFDGHPLERELYQPLVGGTMLELGNKKGGDGTPYKVHFEALGFAHTSVDINGEDGALKLDLQQPLGLGTFDMVANIGTTEHCGRQLPVWRNVCDAMHVGSVFVSTTPHPEGWPEHGSHHPTPGVLPIAGGAQRDGVGAAVRRLRREADIRADEESGGRAGVHDAGRSVDPVSGAVRSSSATTSGGNDASINVRSLSSRSLCSAFISDRSFS